MLQLHLWCPVKTVNVRNGLGIGLVQGLGLHGSWLEFGGLCLRLGLGVGCGRVRVCVMVRLGLC